MKQHTVKLTEDELNTLQKCIISHQVRLHEGDINCPVKNTQEEQECKDVWIKLEMLKNK